MRENYALHKLHSLTGIIPIGFYLVQHLTLNSFALAGPDKFNGVINFFETIPPHFFWVVKYGFIWLPLLFHAVYGMFIYSRGKGNYSENAYKYRENRYYSLQRWSGIVAFLFLCYHMPATSLNASINGPEGTIYYDQWARLLSQGGYAVLGIYIVGVVASAYHFSYGIWNFCIRWGITISDKAQQRMGRFATGAFLLISFIGILALIGFFKPILQRDEGPKVALVGLDSALADQGR
jgi:succinate dehydrogenase / fumarate reductase cytochrome b subunit